MSIRHRRLRPGRPPADPGPLLHPVVTDEQVIVRHPVRKWRTIVLLFAIAIVTCSLAAGYAGARVGYDQSAKHTDVRVRALEADLASRKASRDQVQAQTDAILEQYRESMCVLIERVPPDQDVDRLRAQYRCGPYRGAVTTAPPAGGTGSSSGGKATPRATAGGHAGVAPPPTRGGGGGSGGGSGGGGGGVTPTPPPPGHSPTPPPKGGPLGGITLCLPIFGCLL